MAKRKKNTTRRTSKARSTKTKSSRRRRSTNATGKARARALDAPAAPFPELQRPPFSLEQRPSFPQEQRPRAAQPAPATSSPSLSQVFEALAAILVPYARLFQSEMHPNMGYCLKASHGRPAKELYFGGVRLHSDHAKYHLFLLYSYPELEAGMSPELRQRLEGKTCFRIERFDRELFVELEALTRACFERFRSAGLFGDLQDAEPGPALAL